MCEVENDLIDEYARGELPSQEKRKFERQFFANPERRQRVEFAMTFARVSSAQERSPSVINREATRNFRDVFSSLFTTLQPALVYATVVLAAAVLIGAWWSFRKTAGPDVAMQPAGPVTPANVGIERSPKATTQDQSPDIAHEGSSRPNSAVPLANANRKAPGGISHAQGTVATFTLLPGTTRDNGTRTTLVIPSGRRIVRLKLELEEHDAMNYRSFAAELNRGDSEKTWASETLSKRNRTLILNIPASSLPAKTANYDLTLRGQAAPGRAFETLGYYYLTIVRE